MFEHPAGGMDVAIQLLQLSQGCQSASDYAIEFRTLSAHSGWNDIAFKAVFQRSLNVELQAELACKGENHSFSECVTLAMKIDNLMLSNPTKSKSPSSRTIPIYQTSSIPNPAPSTVQSNSELMQLGISKLSTEERSRRLIHNLCIYCGEAGHVNTVCPLISWRTTTATSRVSVDNLSPQLRNFSLSVSRLLLKMVLFISQH